MKTTILSFTLFLASYFAFGQCGPYTITTTPNACNYVLNMFGAASASQIVWNLNGVPDTARRGPVGVTVAGGNGFGAAANQFWPISVCLDAIGNIYVVDVFNYRVQKFPAGSTSATNGITVAGGNGQGSAANQLNDPQAIYIDRSGNIYVADGNNNRIQKFPAGSTSATLATTVAGGNGQGNAANQFYNPTGIFIDSMGNMYVADQFNQRIQKFPAGSTDTTNGATVAGGNGWGNDSNQFEAPTSVYIDPSGNIYVTDAGNLSRIQKFPATSTSSTNGITIAGGNGQGSAANQLNDPNSIYIDRSGNIYVNDEDNYRVQKFPAGSTSTTNAVTVAGGNGHGTTSNQLGRPQGIYLDSLLNIYIADYTNARIQKWSQPATVGLDTSIDVIPPGVYSATVTDTFGCVKQSDTVTLQTRVSAYFTLQPSGTPNVLYGINQCSGTGITCSWSWSQTDTTTTIGDTPSYIYSSAGSYQICVMVSDTTGCSVNYCDTSVYLSSVFFNLNSFSSFLDTICSGSTYTFSGNSISASGNYYDTLTSVTGSDSIIILTLTVDSNSSSSLSDTICQSHPYTFGGRSLSMTGTYFDTLTSFRGCDSIITLTLTVHPASVNLSQSICPGATYSFGGHNLSAPGTYTDTLTSSYGCDSIVILFLTFLPIVDTISQNLCQGNSYLFGGRTLTTSGTYLDTFYSVLGCDSSIVTLNLTVIPNGSYTLTARDSSCTYIELSVSGASAAEKIVWTYNGIAIDSVSRAPIGPVTTIAGGNMAGNDSSHLDGPSDVYLDNSGNIYVADQVNNRIQKFPAGSTSGTNGVTIGGGNGYGSAPDQFEGPQGIFVDNYGNIYVVDAGNGRIQQFPPNSTSATSGATVAGGNGQGSAANQIDPLGVYVDRSGYIYVSDFYNERIQKFPPNSTSGSNGITVAGGNGQGNAANQLNFPNSIYVDITGNIYVADYNNNRIQRFPPGSTSNTNGVTVAGGNGQGSAANQFSNPAAVYLDSSGNLYVSDVGNRRIQKFPAGSTSATNGITVAGGNGIGSAADQFDFTGGLYVDAAGNIYVADAGDTYWLPDSNNRIQKWSQPPVLAINNSILVVPAGAYSVIVTDTFGCIAPPDTIIVNPYSNSISQNICQGSTYTFNGRNLSTSGSYYDTLISSTGCDSIITLRLTVNSSSATSISDTICQNQPYTFGGHSLSMTGTYFDTLTSSHGCDSIITLSLTVSPISASNISSSICPGNGFTLGTRTYTTSGTYFDTLTSSHGCDSIINLDLIVLPDTVTAYFTLQPSGTPHLWYVLNQCTGPAPLTYVWNWGDSTTSTGDTASHTYDTAGNYTVCVTVTDSAGCSATYCDTSVYLFKNGSGSQMVYVEVVNHIPNGISEISDQSTIHLFPNPNKGSFTLATSGNIGSDYIISDMLGHVIAQQNILSDTQSIELPEAAEGVYTLAVKGAQPIRFVVVR